MKVIYRKPVNREGSVLELNDDAGHVVAADAARGCDVGGDDLIEDFFDGGGQLLALLVADHLTEFIDRLLRSEAVPDAVAGNDQEGRIGIKLLGLDLGHGGNHLVREGDARVRLVLEIAEGPGEVEDALHSVVFDKASGSLDSLLLSGELGFVINA